METRTIPPSLPRHHVPWRLASLLFAALFGSTGVATTLEKLELPEMVDAADVIVIGHCRGAEMLWVGRSLYTRYRIEVDETLLGAPRNEVLVVVPGGIDMNRKHPIAVVVPDAPMLQRDEHVALLLEEGQPPMPGDMTIVGFNQGRIELADTGVSAVATKPLADPVTQKSSTGLTPAAQTARDLLQSLIETRGQPRSKVPPLRVGKGSQQ